MWWIALRPALNPVYAREHGRRGGRCNDGHGTGSGAGGDGGDEGGEGIESRSQKSCVDVLPGILIIRVSAADIRKEKGN